MLYITATPIGNLADMTFRAVRVMKEVDFLICEDRKVSMKLFSLYEISKPLMIYHEHNALRQRGHIIKRILSGQKAVLISSAGTPLISDPGYKLILKCIEKGIEITSLPGANAAVNALVMSGISPSSFCFLGFLPNKSGKRKRFLNAYKEVMASLIFYESPHRIKSSLKDVISVLGNRKATILREMTKKFEEKIRGNLQQITEIIDSRKDVKGEITVVVEGLNKKSLTQNKDINLASKTLLKAASI